MAGTVSMSWSLQEKKLHAVLCAVRDTEIAVILPPWAEGIRVKQAEDGSADRSLCMDGSSVRLKLRAGETVEIGNV